MGILDPHPLDFFERVDQLVADLHHRFEGDLRLLECHHHLVLRRFALRVLLQHLVGLLLELVHALERVLQDLLERPLALRGRRLCRDSGRNGTPEGAQSADVVDHASIPGSAARFGSSPWPLRPPTGSPRRRATPPSGPPSRPWGSRWGNTPSPRPTPSRPRGDGRAAAPRGTPTGPPRFSPRERRPIPPSGARSGGGRGHGGRRRRGRSWYRHWRGSPRSRPCAPAGPACPRR